MMSDDGYSSTIAWMASELPQTEKQEANTTKCYNELDTRSCDAEISYEELQDQALDITVYETLGMKEKKNLNHKWGLYN